MSAESENAKSRAVGGEGTRHEAFADPVSGGWDGYEGACRTCDWRGPRRGVHDKSKAQDDAIRHAETAPKVVEGSDLARALADALRGFLKDCTPTDGCTCVDCEGLRALAAWDTQERETNENEADR